MSLEIGYNVSHTNIIGMPIQFNYSNYDVFLLITEHDPFTFLLIVLTTC